METPALDRIYKTLVILTISITALILLSDLIIPIAFAGLFSIVLLPVTRRLEKKTGRTLAISVVLLGVFFLMGMLGWFVISQLTSLVSSLPDLEQKFYAMVTNTSNLLQDKLGLSSNEQMTYVKEALQKT